VFLYRRKRFLGLFGCNSLNLSQDEWVLPGIRPDKRPSTLGPSQAPGQLMGRRLFIPNPIATQSIAWKSLMGYGLRSSQPGGGTFPFASYATKRIAL
jgi:hypothetical protein